MFYHRGWYQKNQGRTQVAFYWWLMRGLHCFIKRDVSSWFTRFITPAPGKCKIHQRKRKKRLLGPPWFRLTLCNWLLCHWLVMDAFNSDLFVDWIRSMERVVGTWALYIWLGDTCWQGAKIIFSCSFLTMRSLFGPISSLQSIGSLSFLVLIRTKPIKWSQEISCSCFKW